MIRDECKWCQRYSDHALDWEWVSSQMLIMASCPFEKCYSIRLKYSFTLWEPNKPIKLSRMMPFSVLSLLPNARFGWDNFCSQDGCWCFHLHWDFSLPSWDLLHFLSSFSHFRSHLRWGLSHLPPKAVGASKPLSLSLWIISQGLRFMLLLTISLNSSGYLFSLFAIFSHRKLTNFSSYPFSLANLLMISNFLRDLFDLANSSYFWGSPPNIFASFLVILSSFPHFSELDEWDPWPCPPCFQNFLKNLNGN